MKLGNAVINPGELNTKVVLRSRTVTVDAGGFAVPGSGQEIVAWCKWTNAHGRDAEIDMANTEGARVFATLLMRYIPGVDETWHVIYRDKVWEVRSIDNIRMRDEYMELKVMRVEVG